MRNERLGCIDKENDGCFFEKVYAKEVLKECAVYKYVRCDWWLTSVITSKDEIRVVHHFQSFQSTHNRPYCLIENIQGIGVFRTLRTNHLLGNPGLSRRGLEGIYYGRVYMMAQ